MPLFLVIGYQSLSLSSVSYGFAYGLENPFTKFPSHRIPYATKVAHGGQETIKGGKSEIREGG
jgi:hypothetical protein